MCETESATGDECVISRFAHSAAASQQNGGGAKAGSMSALPPRKRLKTSVVSGDSYVANTGLATSPIPLGLSSSSSPFSTPASSAPPSPARVDPRTDQTPTATGAHSKEAPVRVPNIPTPAARRHEPTLASRGRSSPESESESSDDDTVLRMQRKRKSPLSSVTRNSTPPRRSTGTVLPRKGNATNENGQRKRSISPTNGTHQRTKRQRTEVPASSSEDEDDEESEDGIEQVYCICRRPYSAEVFMIACDECDEWYHGKCVDITERKAKKLDTYVCPSCLEGKQDPEAGASAHGRKRKRPMSSDPVSTTTIKKERERTPQVEKEPEGTHELEQEENEEEQEENEDDESSPPVSPTRPSRPMVRRSCANDGCNKDATASSKYCSIKCGIQVAKQKLANEKDAGVRGQRTPINGSGGHDGIKLERRHEVAGTPGHSTETLNGVHNGYTNGRGSPDLSSGLTISVSDSEDLKLLHSLESQRADVEAKLASLRDRGSKLVAAVNFSATLISNSDDSSATGREKRAQPAAAAVMDIMDCFSCGQPIPGRNFARHIEQCYAKKEGNVCSSTHKNDDLVADDGSTIAHCNYYDSRNGSYCTRLADSCPFHSAKKKKVMRNQLCGCPTSDFTSGYCERLKKDCPKHFNWENIRRLELAQELNRERTLLKSLGEEIELVKSRIRRRNLAADNQHRTIEENSEKK
eukprot:TRINITY_DN109_c1_g1_i1.p1 TRINITY_DN109_c1_g1~~TRINITY_DN109_c1_g1_i1.p1  ORF type:complete len:695 (-),score=76.40 TRINITY_DN109_c1_g1_i1:59-2143(-)